MFYLLFFQVKEIDLNEIDVTLCKSEQSVLNVGRHDSPLQDADVSNLAALAEQGMMKDLTKEDLLALIGGLKLDFTRENELNNSLLDELKNQDELKAELEKSLLKAEEMLTNEKRAFEAQEVTAKLDLVRKQEEFEDLNTELTSQANKSENKIVELKQDLKNSEETATVLNYRVQNMEAELQAKDTLLKQFSKEVDKISSLNDDIGNLLASKKRFWKPATKNRKTTAMQLLASSRNVFKNIRSLFSRK